MNNRRLHAAAIAVVVVLIAPASLWAWGRIGHRASALLTQSRLSPAATAAIRDLLEPGETLADISIWADQQRDIPRTGPWHYVNVPITERRFDACCCQPRGCVVSKVEDSRRVLRDANADRKQKQEALKFFVHFLQDMHQPVHVGDNGNRGGNDLQLRFFDTGTNLHRLLDSQVIERYSEDEARWVQELNLLATPENSAEWSRGSVADWASESLEAAKVLYCQPGSQDFLKPGAKLGEAYYERALPVVRLQLARAGVRLARMVNQIFG